MGANPLKITCLVQVASFYRFLPIILVILVEALKFKADSMYFMYLSEKVDNPLLLQTDTRRIRWKLITLMRIRHKLIFTFHKPR